MQITRKDCVRVLTGLGFKMAKKWEKDRVMRKVLELEKLVTEDVEIGDPELDTLLDEMISAIRDSEEIELVEEKAEQEEKEEQEEEAQAEVQEEEEKPKKEKKTSSGEKKTESRKKDRFGNLLSSQGAKINQFITEEPLDVTALAVRAELSVSRVKGHVKWLKKGGYVEIDNDAVRWTGKVKE